MIKLTYDSNSFDEMLEHVQWLEEMGTFWVLDAATRNDGYVVRIYGADEPPIIKFKEKLG